jgi:hypothetical protein
MWRPWLAWANSHPPFPLGKTRTETAGRKTSISDIEPTSLPQYLNTSRERKTPHRVLSYSHHHCPLKNPKANLALHISLIFNMASNRDSIASNPAAVRLFPSLIFYMKTPGWGFLRQDISRDVNSSYSMPEPGCIGRYVSFIQASLSPRTYC